jgi:hypothetical protein
MDDAGIRPISPDDTAYRRVRLEYAFFRDGQVSQKGLGPNSGDVSGMSIVIDSLANSPLDCLDGKLPDRYVIAAFPVRCIYEAGFTIERDPKDGNPGHCNIIGVNKNTIRSKEVVEFLDRVCRAENDLLRLIWPLGHKPEGV